MNRASLVAAALLWVGTAVPACADVLAIGPDGTTLRRSGAGAVRWSGGAGDPATADGDIALPEDLNVPAGAMGPVAPPPVPARYTAAVDRIAAKYDISPALLEAVVWQESRWREGAVSRVGAVGLAQLMPATARALGVDAREPVANLEGGARFLRAQLDLFDGDLEKALAAYNAGPARVLRAGGVPAITETRAYVAAVIRHLSAAPATPSSKE